MHAERDRWGRRGALCLALAGAACARGERAQTTPRPSEEAREEIAALREQARKRERRIRELESRLALLEAEQRELRYGLAESRGPLRETVRIGAHRRQLRQGGAPSAAGGAVARPVLRIGRARRGPLEPVPVVSEKLPVAPLPDLPSEHAAQAAKRAYRAALRLLKDRKFKAAARAFNDFLVRYPGDERAPLALFWRGEALFATQQYARAIEAFEGAMARAPRGRRAPDALLKIAVCQQRLGDARRARSTLQRLKTQFPDSDAARQASREDA